VEGSPDGVPFAVICLLVRVVEAFGAAALITSSFAIIANTFPDNITAMFVRKQPCPSIGVATATGGKVQGLLESVTCTFRCTSQAFRPKRHKKSISVLVIRGFKCTLAASRVAPC